jgi:RNA-binding protein YhbY
MQRGACTSRSLRHAPTFSSRCNFARVTHATNHRTHRVYSAAVASALDGTIQQEQPVPQPLTLSKPELRHQGALNNKEMKEIKSMANGLAATKRLIRVTMGKKGITDNFIVDCMRALRAHEVIRVAVADGADMDRDDASQLLTSMLDCVCVQAIGSSLTLYRSSQLPMPSNIVDTAAEKAGQKVKNQKRS